MSPQYPQCPRFLRSLCTLALLLSLTGGEARGSSDVDVDVAIGQLKALDRITKDEFARYEAALNKYADLKQKLLLSMGTLLEADEAEVNGKWDQICDGGLAGIAELAKAAPVEKTQLKAFYDVETGIWEVLKKIELPEAEEAETRHRRLLETITPTLDKTYQEQLDEDKQGDESTSKAWAKLREATLILTRVIVQITVDSPEMGEWIEGRLKDLKGTQEMAKQVGHEAKQKAGRLKAFKARLVMAIEIHKRVKTADEESMRQNEKGIASLRNLQHSRAVMAHAQQWVKIAGAHYAQTRAAMQKYEEIVNGRLVGRINDETKARLGDQEFYKERLSQLEADAKAIEDGLTQLERRINEYRDGDFKNHLKDVLAKCRSVVREISDIRATIKSEYESALSDAGLN